jgi:hypothetical protein
MDQPLHISPRLSHHHLQHTSIYSPSFFHSQDYGDYGNDNHVMTFTGDKCFGLDHVCQRGIEEDAMVGGRYCATPGCSLALPPSKLVISSLSSVEEHYISIT